MKILVLTSDSFRHSYFIEKISQTFTQPTVIVQKKKKYYEIQKRNSYVVRKHFKVIKITEEKWFKINLNKSNELVDDINDLIFLDKIKKENYDAVCLFGTVVLNDTWLKIFPDKIINLHLGLSPFYRGSATLFWPFVNKELEYLGTTIHLANKKVDGGKILHRVLPNFIPYENYYDITTRLIKDSINIFPEIVLSYLKGKIKPFSQENLKGKYYKKMDFSEKDLLNVLTYMKKGLTENEIKQIVKNQNVTFNH